MKTFFFLMFHWPSLLQVVDVRKRFGSDVKIVALAPAPTAENKGGEVIPGVEYLGATKSLEVPTDPELPRAWFETRAAEILEAVGVRAGDLVLTQGQQSLSNAIIAAAYNAGCEFVCETTTERLTAETVMPDGNTYKAGQVVHVGFREHRIFIPANLRKLLEAGLDYGYAAVYGAGPNDPRQEGRTLEQALEGLKNLL